MTGGGEWGWRMSPSSTLRAVAGVSEIAVRCPSRRSAGSSQSGSTPARRRLVADAVVGTWLVAGNSYNLAGYHRSAGATLDGSGDDTPLFVQADRRLRRVGVLASVTHSRGRHVLKVGAEAARLSLHEDFLFAVTDPDEDEADFTPAVKGFTIERPFVFSGTGTPSLVFRLRAGLDAAGRSAHG